MPCVYLRVTAAVSRDFGENMYDWTWTGVCACAGVRVLPREQSTHALRFICVCVCVRASACIGVRRWIQHTHIPQNWHLGRRCLLSFWRYRIFRVGFRSRSIFTNCCTIPIKSALSVQTRMIYLRVWSSNSNDCVQRSQLKSTFECLWSPVKQR